MSAPGAPDREVPVVSDPGLPGVVRHAADGVIVACDEAAAALLATTPAGLVGQATLFPRLDVFDRSGCPVSPETEPVWEVLRDGRPAAVSTLRYWRSDGTPAWIEVRSEPRREGDGLGATAAVSLVRDVSRGLAAAGTLAGTGMDAAGRLAGSVAISFNNLLTVLSGYSELMLLDLPADDPRRRYALEVKRACDRGGVLTGQLFAVSRGLLTPPPPQIQPSCTVLLVVRDALIGDFARQVLAEAGCTVLEARDGEAVRAIAATTAVPVDVVVADLAPEENGGELRRRLAGERPGLRTLFLVSRGDPLAGGAGDGNGDAAVLTVPFERDELVAKVRALVAGSVDAAGDAG